MNTIKSSSEINKIFEEGRRIGAPELSLIVLRNDEQHDHEGRVAFIAGKKQGNAVWRNRAKRRMREACRQCGGPINGYDIVFLARKKVTTSPWQVLLTNTEKALKKVSS